MTDPSFASPQHDTASRAAEPPKGDDWISPPKFIFIAAIALATLIPNYFVSGLIAERESRQDVVENEFTRNWGPQQHVYSPVLVVHMERRPNARANISRSLPIVSRSSRTWSHSSANAGCFTQRSTTPRSRCRVRLRFPTSPD